MKKDNELEKEGCLQEKCPHYERTVLCKWPCLVCKRMPEPVRIDGSSVPLKNLPEEKDGFCQECSEWLHKMMKEKDKEFQKGNYITIKDMEDLKNHFFQPCKVCEKKDGDGPTLEMEKKLYWKTAQDAIADARAWRKKFELMVNVKDEIYQDMIEAHKRCNEKDAQLLDANTILVLLSQDKPQVMLTDELADYILKWMGKDRHGKDVTERLEKGGWMDPEKVQENIEKAEKKDDESLHDLIEEREKEPCKGCAEAERLIRNVYKYCHNGTDMEYDDSEMIALVGWLDRYAPKEKKEGGERCIRCKNEITGAMTYHGPTGPYCEECVGIILKGGGEE